MSTRKWKGALKGRKLKKGKNVRRGNRWECRIHGQNKWGLIRCSCCNWSNTCPLCHVRCPICQRILTKHPILGKIKAGPYWSATQIEDYEKGFAKDEEND